MKTIFYLSLVQLILFSPIVVSQNIHSNELHPSWSPDGAHIVFFSDRSGNNEIYTVNIKTKVFKRLTNNNENDESPVWSPDGTSIAFHSNRSGNYEIWTIDPDGKNLKQITDTPDAEMSPAWSPDGKSLAINTKVGDLWEIQIVDVESGQAEILLQGNGDYLTPEWSPDGEYIIYSFAPTPGDHSGVELFRLDLKTGNRTKLTDLGNSNASISENGKLVAFNSSRDGNWEIYLMEPNGKKQKRITTNSLQLENFKSSDIDGQPDILSGKKMIAFTSGRMGNFDIYIMNLSGKNLMNLTENWMKETETGDSNNNH